MKQCIDIYTACYADNKEKKYKGVGFGAVVVTKTKRRTFSEFSNDSTYLEIWMDEVATLLESLIGNGVVHDFESVALGIHTYEMNTGKVMQKIKKVYEQLRQYDSESWDVVDLKLRRANKPYYPYHDAMVRIVKVMLQYDKSIPLTLILFTKKLKGVPEMTLALQHAEKAVISQ